MRITDAFWILGLVIIGVMVVGDLKWRRLRRVDVQVTEVTPGGTQLSQYAAGPVPWAPSCW